MAQLDASIILQGQSPNILGALAQSNEMAGMQKDRLHTQGYRNMLEANGAGIMAGDQGAMNALAMYDPSAALGVQAQRQSLAFSAEEMQMRREEGKRRATEAFASAASTLTAEQLAQEQDQITKGLSGAAFFYQNQDRAGYDNFLAQNGMDPAEFPFEQFPAHAAMFEGALEAMQTFAPPSVDPNDRYKVVGGSLFDLTAEGGPRPVGQGAMQETTIFGPDGKPVMVQGGPGANVKFTEGQSKDNVYATRAAGALEKLESPIDPNNPNAGTVADSLTDLSDSLGAKVPMVGNFLKSQAYQVAETAGAEYLQAILRKDTGAAITEPEQKLYGLTYLPQPGDGPEVLAYKSEARIRALEAIKSGMNPDQFEAMTRAEASVVAQIGGPNDAPAATGETVIPQGFATNPTVTGAAEANGLTVQELWDNMTPESRARLGG